MQEDTQALEAELEAKSAERHQLQHQLLASPQAQRPAMRRQIEAVDNEILGLQARYRLINHSVFPAQQSYARRVHRAGNRLRIPAQRSADPLPDGSDAEPDSPVERSPRELAGIRRLRAHYDELDEHELLVLEASPEPCPEWRQRHRLMREGFQAEVRHQIALCRAAAQVPAWLLGTDRGQDQPVPIEDAIEPVDLSLEGSEGPASAGGPEESEGLITPAASPPPADQPRVCHSGLLTAWRCWRQPEQEPEGKISTPKAAFRAMRERRHRKLACGASHFTQQQLLAALQALQGDAKSCLHGWDQSSVDRTMLRWRNEKQRKVQDTENHRTAEAKFWHRQAKKTVGEQPSLSERVQVIGKLRMQQMERRAQAAPVLAQARWKAAELQRNFGSWLRKSRSVAAISGLFAVTVGSRADRAGTPFKAVPHHQQAQLLSALPEELVARTLLTAGAVAMATAASSCRELHVLVETPYMWQLLNEMRWGAISLNRVERQLGWKFAYIRRARTEQMSELERCELNMQNLGLFIKELDDEEDLTEELDDDLTVAA